MQEDSLKLLLAQAAASCTGQSTAAGSAQLTATPQLLDNQLINSSDFRMYCFKILPCTRRYGHDWTACPFAHPGEKATRRCPQKTQYVPLACPDIKQTGSCPKGQTCNYAHNIFEYWCHPLRFRTQLCSYGADCKRPICFFAHSYNELRVVDQALLQELEKQMDLLGEGAGFGFPPSSKRQGRETRDSVTAGSPRERERERRDRGEPYPNPSPARADGAASPCDAGTPPSLSPRVSRTTAEVLAATAWPRSPRASSEQIPTPPAVTPTATPSSPDAGSPASQAAADTETAAAVTPSASPRLSRTSMDAASPRLSRTSMDAIGDKPPVLPRLSRTSLDAAAAGDRESVRPTGEGAGATQEVHGPGPLDPNSPAALQLQQLQLAAQKQRQASSQALQAMEKQYTPVKLHAAAALLGIDVTYLAQALYTTPPPPASNLSPSQASLLQAMVRLAGSPGPSSNPTATEAAVAAAAAAASAAATAGAAAAAAGASSNPSLGGWASGADVMPPSLSLMLAESNAVARQQHGQPQLYRSASATQYGVGGAASDLAMSASPLPSLSANQEQMAAAVKLLAELARASAPASPHAAGLPAVPVGQRDVWGSPAGAGSSPAASITLAAAAPPPPPPQVQVVGLAPSGHLVVAPSHQLPMAHATPCLASVQLSGGAEVVEMDPREWQQLLHQLGGQAPAPAPLSLPAHLQLVQEAERPASSMHMPSMSTLAHGDGSHAVMVSAVSAAPPTPPQPDLTGSSPFAPSAAAIAAASAAVSGTSFAPPPLTTLQARAQAGALMGLMSKPKPVVTHALPAGMVLTLGGGGTGGTAGSSQSASAAPSPVDVLSLHSARSGPTSGAASCAGSDDGRLGGGTSTTRMSGSGGGDSEYAGAGQLMTHLSDLIGEEQVPSLAFDVAGFKLGGGGSGRVPRDGPAPGMVVVQGARSAREQLWPGNL